MKNGLLPIALSDSEVDALFHDVLGFPGFQLTIDLESQKVTTENTSKSFDFEIDSFRKHCLLNGLDDISLTLEHVDEIKKFEDRHKLNQPWLFS